MERPPKQNPTTVAAVPGGYLLHSPKAIATAARLGLVHSLVIAGVVGAAAYDAGRWDFWTWGMLASIVAWALVIPLLPWNTKSFHWFAKIYFMGSGTCVLAAVHFNNPYLLLGIFPEAFCFADIYWYNKRLVALHYAILFGVTGGAAAMIGNDGALTVALMMPTMAVSALACASLSNHVICAMLARAQFSTTVKSLLKALFVRDGYTGGHSEDTVGLAIAVADELKLSEDAREQLADVALLHDIGKIGIPNSILQKPGKLDEGEWAVMRTHPEVGERILSDVPGFEDVAKAIRHEHERWDGGGYPDGIAGEEIPLASRIVLACDAYHAMTSDRPYRSAMDPEEARTELTGNAGTQFDPSVVQALTAAIDSGRIAWHQQNRGHEGLDNVIELNSPGSGQQVPRATASPVGDLKGALTDAESRSRVWTIQWSFTAIAMTALLAITGFEWAGAAFIGIAVVVAALPAIAPVPRDAWTMGTAVTSIFVIPLVAWQIGDPSIVSLLVLPAWTAIAQTWDTRALRIMLLVLSTASFVVLPFLFVPGDALSIATVCARAFPGVILAGAYLVPHLREMQFDRRRFAATMDSLMRALEARDGYTGDHSKETLDIAMRVAETVGLGDAALADLYDTAILHDIGKIGIPDEILNKPGRLDESEWVTMREHPVIGQQIVGAIPGFEEVAKAIRHEHERWDGGGYPDGIRGEEIPIASRIVLACDALHAMTSDRPYRHAMPLAKAREELIANAGTQFDPNVVYALLVVLDKHREEPVKLTGSASDELDAASGVVEHRAFA